VTTAAPGSASRNAQSPATRNSSSVEHALKIGTLAKLSSR
jgi:hypothetical protein